MKRLLLAALAIVLYAATSSAQSTPGSICIYADASGTDCNIIDDGGHVQVHMLHVRTTYITLSEFKLDVSATNWTYLGDIWNYPIGIGNAIDGMTLAFGECLHGPIYLGLSSFIGSSEPPCTQISIVPHPNGSHPDINSVTCDEHRIFPTGGLAFVNPNASCFCSVPVRETTWGQVKALYR